LFVLIAGSKGKNLSCQGFKLKVEDRRRWRSWLPGTCPLAES